MKVVKPVNPSVVEIVLVTAEGKRFTLNSLNTIPEILQQIVFGKRNGRISYRGIKGTVMEAVFQNDLGEQKRFVTTWEAAERFGDAL